MQYIFTFFLLHYNFIYVKNFTSVIVFILVDVYEMTKILFLLGFKVLLNFVLGEFLSTYFSSVSLHKKFQKKIYLGRFQGLKQL